MKTFFKHFLSQCYVIGSETIFGNIIGKLLRDWRYYI